MHRIRWGARIVATAALALTALVTAPPTASAQAVPVAIDVCTLSVSWTSGTGITGSGTCLHNLSPTSIQILYAQPTDTCGQTTLLTFSRGDGRGQMGYLYFAPNFLEVPASLLGLTDSPSIRGGEFSPFANTGPRGVTFLGSERCTGPAQSLHGTVVISGLWNGS